MHGTNSSPESFSAAATQVARRLLAIGGNRFELLRVELGEERDRLIESVLLVAGVAVLSILAGVALTFGVALWLWEYSPVLTLGGLTLLYAGVAVVLGMRLRALWSGWTLLPATAEELRKDVGALDARLEAGFRGTPGVRPP